MARMISPRTAAELADYAAAGRIGDRKSHSEGHKAGPWVFGLTVITIMSITLFQACQRQLSETPARQSVVERSNAKEATKEKATRPASPTQTLKSRTPASIQPVYPQPVQVPKRDIQIVTPSTKPDMWRDPRNYANRQPKEHH